MTDDVIEFALDRVIVAQVSVHKLNVRQSEGCNRFPSRLDLPPRAVDPEARRPGQPLRQREPAAQPRGQETQQRRVLGQLPTQP